MTRPAAKYPEKCASLLEQVRVLREPSRTVDVQIAVYVERCWIDDSVLDYLLNRVGEASSYEHYAGPASEWRRDALDDIGVRRYTRSLDVAVGLVEEVRPGGLAPDVALARALTRLSEEGGLEPLPAVPQLACAVVAEALVALVGARS